MKEATKVVLVDDHTLLRKGLAKILVDELGYRVLYECNNGMELMDAMKTKEVPDVVLMDINMPKMDGYQATKWLKSTSPLTNVIALSMSDDETSIIRMLKSGARGYILKDASPSELKEAIDSVVTKGFYYSELVSGSLLHSINQDDDDSTEIKQVLKLKSKDIEFLKLVCTEMTYKEIAEKMFLSPRTIDGYRDDLFQQLEIKSRVGLVLFAIKNGIVRF